MDDGALAAEHEEIVRSIGRLLPDRTAARRAADGGPALDRELHQRLADLGVFGIGLPESHGGVGLSLLEGAAVAEALAKVVAPAPVSAALLAGAILGASDTEAAKAWGERLAAGETVVGACLSASEGVPENLEVKPTGEGRAELTGRITDALDGAALDVFLVWGAGRWWAVRADAQGLSRTELPSFDPTRRMATIEFANVAAEAVSDMDAQIALNIAWTLMSAEAIGVAQAALDMAREYALIRQQFGVVIGRFQAIKHKLTDSLVAIEASRSALTGAARASGMPDQRSARTAKATATAAGAAVVAEAVQIHGAIGNTWEHDLHLLLRRAKHCQLSLGSPDSHIEILAAQLLQDASDGARTGGGGRASLDAVLSLDPSTHAFAEELNSWLDANLTKEMLGAMHRGAPEERRQARRDWQAHMAEGGWAGIHWPKAFGGREASFTEQVIYHATLAGRGLPVIIGNRGLSLVGPTLISHGSREQQAKFVETTRRADILWASGLSERGSGSDLASLSTRGVVDGDDLVINGHKIWTTSAQFADWLFTLVRTGPQKPKHQGITCILIPLNSPGITIRPIKRMNGDEDFNEVFFDDVRVPLANVVGDLGRGWTVARTTLSHEHLTNFLGQQLSQANVVSRVIRTLAERQERGEPIEGGLRRRVAQAWMSSQILRLNGLRNVAKLAKGQDPGPEGSIQKLLGQEEERRLFELAMDVHGAAGLASPRWGAAYLSTRASTIGGGTSEIHRNKIAERVLGMPRDLGTDEEA